MNTLLSCDTCNGQPQIGTEFKLKCRCGGAYIIKGIDGVNCSSCNDNVVGTLGKWKAMYETRKTNLAEFDQDLSQNKNLIEYNIMCCEAMILMECIFDLQEALHR